MQVACGVSHTLFLVDPDAKQVADLAIWEPEVAVEEEAKPAPKPGVLVILLPAAAVFRGPFARFPGSPFALLPAKWQFCGVLYVNICFVRVCSAETCSWQAKSGSSCRWPSQEVSTAQLRRLVVA